MISGDNMTDELIRRAIIQRGGCRLCMAPDSECVPIFATAAADKEPLSSKIQACVNIKVHQADRLSARVCHACISYLNSWQSFKNRCYAAQKKQRGLLELWMAKERSKQKSTNQPQTSLLLSSQNRRPPVVDNHQQRQIQSQKLIKQVLGPQNHSSPINQSQSHVTTFPLNSSVDVSFIKEEPDDEPMEEEDEVDPTQFLARENDDEDDANYPANEGPPILTSLGLTAINPVNPFSFLSTELDVPKTEPNTDDSVTITPQMRRPRSSNNQPACTICDMKFSNRANARRHERNIHHKGVLAMGQPQQQTPGAGSSSSMYQMHMAKTQMSGERRRSDVSYDMPIDIDYNKPEQYRYLLTDSKLYFIKRHIEFLEQYQSMKCNCCDKHYPTYKFFMAHMRKRYNTLSRNLCFKCLTQFETKPMFIAHLKKRNCPNLYRIYKADPSISKDPLPPLGRVSTKEIISNKTYGCRLCTKTFRLKVDFRGHVLEEHTEEQKNLSMGPSCGFCNATFDDPLVKKRHYSNMECLSFLICGTCEEKFDTLPAYIEHVYSTHLPPAAANGESGAEEMDALSPGQQQALKYPQNCRVCGKLYNNYYNVLRHMESKHPDQLPGTYRCEKCNVGYPRQTELRDHMFKLHGISLPKVKRDNYFCRVCGTTFEQKDFWLDHMASKYSRYYCSSCDLETESTADFEAHLVEHQKAKTNVCPICQHSFNSERSLDTHMAVVHKARKEDYEDVGSVTIKKEPEIEDISEMNGDEDEYEDDQQQQQQQQQQEEEPDTNGNDEIEDAFGSLRKRLKLDEISITKASFDEPRMKKCTMCAETFSTTVALADHLKSHIAANGKDDGSNTLIPTTSILPVGGSGIKSIGSGAVSGGGRSSSGGGRSTSAVGVGSRSGGFAGFSGRSLGTYQVNSRMRCRICQKRIHTKTSYKRHMLQVHQVRDCVFIRCQLCPAEFSNDKGLKVHMFRTHAITVQQMQEDESLRPVPKQESTEPMARPPSKILTKIAPKLMFECDICHTVYRNRDQLKAHKRIVHGTEGTQNDDTQGELDVEDIQEPQLPVPEAWWQCRYCDETFNASKKLTIHMNSHEEHDTTDNTCKDCGNTYRTRKSLWVHRHKKHPRLPNPSTCELCNKVFFDKTELFHHLKTHSNADVFSHLQEMHQQLEDDQQQKQKQQQQKLDNDDIKLEVSVVHPREVEIMSCHLCGQKFQNKRVLSKHLRLHAESDAYANSPLAAMLADTTISIEENGSVEYSYPTYKGQMVDGEYACDMCPKTFPLMTALKVHRGWHFRSPDGRQVTDPSNMWQPDTVPQSKQKRGHRSHNPPVCPYCHSTFASGNNLRRHIVEVHKRNEAKMMRGNGTVSESVFVEKELECQACGITFSSRPEWIDHKIGHARTMKPSTTFEWGCEICGKIFTRKERLLAHMVLHLNGKDDDNSMHSNEQPSEMGDSRSSMSSQSHSQPSLMSTRLKIKKEIVEQVKMENNVDEENQGEYQEEEEEEEDENEENEEVDEGDAEVVDGDEDEGAEENEENDEEQQDEEGTQTLKLGTQVRHEAAYSCDLCQVFFNTAKELRRHVTSHIINAPDVSMGESNEQQRYQQEQQPQQQQQPPHENENLDEDAEDEEVGDDGDEEDDNDDEVEGEDEDEDGEEEDEEDDDYEQDNQDQQE